MPTPRAASTLCCTRDALNFHRANFLATIRVPGSDVHSDERFSGPIDRDPSRPKCRKRRHHITKCGPHHHHRQDIPRSLFSRTSQHNFNCLYRVSSRERAQTKTRTPHSASAFTMFAPQRASIHGKFKALISTSHRTQLLRAAQPCL